MARSQVAAISASVSRRSRPNPPGTTGVSSSGATLNETMTARDRSERAPHAGELHHNEGADRGAARVEVEIAALAPLRGRTAGQDPLNRYLRCWFTERGRPPSERSRADGFADRRHAGGSAHGTGLDQMATYLDAMGRVDDAIAEVKRAREIEPLSLNINAQLGRMFYHARQYDQTVKESGKSLELDPNYAQTHLYLGWAYEQQARYEEAIAELHKGLTLSGGESEMAGALGYAYAVSGKRGEAEKALVELKERSKHQYVAPFDIAVIYVGLGATSPTFEWLG